MRWEIGGSRNGHISWVTAQQRSNCFWCFSIPERKAVDILVRKTGTEISICRQIEIRYQFFLRVFPRLLFWCHNKQQVDVPCEKWIQVVLKATKKKQFETRPSGKLHNMSTVSIDQVKFSKTAVDNSIASKVSDTVVVQEKLTLNHDDNKPECTSPSIHRPIGPKRTIFAKDTRKKKRSCHKSSNEHGGINAAMLQQFDPNISIEEANVILNDYNHASKILQSQSTNTDDVTPSLEYMIQLINEWRPKREIICMYVRWSKRLRRNYHLDSIACWI